MQSTSSAVFVSHRLSRTEPSASASDRPSARITWLAVWLPEAQADPEEALRILLDNQNEENFPLSETVERQSMETLLPLMETADARFLSQTEECWQKNIDWLYDSGLIQTRVEPAQVMAELDWRK